MQPLSPRQVVLDDPYWSPRLEVNARRAIFHQWEQLEASGCIDNFCIAAGELQGFREGWYFADSDAYKWLDAAARIVALHPDPHLGVLMDSLIDLLGRAQSPDGYLFTYNQIHFPGERWANLQIEHELYCHGHLIEAGVSHFEATGQSRLLELVCRAADRIVTDFQGGGPECTPGHEEIEIALIRLYYATGQAPYLELARQFIEQRGRAHGFALSILRQNSRVDARREIVNQRRQAYIAAHLEHAAFKLPPGNPAKLPRGDQLRWKINALSGKYFQQHTPIRRQTTPVGHAVRFGYLETAIAMLHRAQPEPSLLPALEQAWERMVTRRMYVTGGLGSLPSLEGFGRDYELDPEYAYAETCAAIASLYWNWEMALIRGEARYSDLFEWQLYNAVAVGMGLGGETYLYNNPLASRGGVTRLAWYAVPCCPSNISRTWADLGKYIFSAGSGEIWVHQYIGNRSTVDLGFPVDITLQSALPWQGEVNIRLELESPVEFTLHLRLPSWRQQPAADPGSPPGVSLKVNGKSFERLPASSAPPATASGYDPRQSCFVSIQRVWSPGDVIQLHFALPIVLRRADPRVKGHSGKVALTRGPLVYCLESIDNPDLDIFSMQIDSTSLRAEQAPQLLGGVWILRGQTVSGQPFTAIPYNLWANRGPSQMNVWVNI